MDIKTLVSNGLASTAMNGGATINPKTGENVTSGYAVGGVMEYKYVTPTLADLEEIQGDVQRMVEAHPNCMVGFWMNDGTLYVDAINITKHEEAARIVAETFNEIAFFNLDTNEEIRVK